MAKKANYSLSVFEIGDIALDGGMSTTLETFGDPVRDTCSFTQADGTTTDFYTEIADDPYLSVTAPGKKTIVLDLYATNGQQLVSIFGGTYTPAASGNPAKWEAPTEEITKEVSVQLTHKDGQKVQFPRVKLTARPEWNFKRTALPLLHITMDVLQPDKVGLGAWTYIEAPTT